eukprot:Sdes_comp18916_c0_seq1m9376
MSDFEEETNTNYFYSGDDYSENEAETSRTENQSNQNSEYNEEEDDDEDEENYYSIISQQENLVAAEAELDDAMSNQTNIIIIDCENLSGQTSSAIRFGNFVHKTAVLSGLACLFTGALARSSHGSFPTLLKFGFPCGFLSISCALLYDASWQFDPCCKYQIDAVGAEFHRVPLEKLRSKSPLVLLRRDDSVRKRLHNTLAFTSALFCSFHIVRFFGGLK